jgi:hypothetical protein
MYLSEGPMSGSDMDADEAEFMAIFGGDPEPETEEERAATDARVEATLARVHKLLNR